MNTLFSFRSCAAALTKFFCLLALMYSFSTQLEATYISIYTTTDNGAITFTGNTLGLDKTTNQNNPGTTGSIGAFITTDTSMQVGSFPVGTTLTWQNNSSTAVLDIPSGSTILHAELIWSGSYGFDPAITLSLIQSSTVTLITPDSVSHTITLNPATFQSRVNSGSNGFYVANSDVTSILTALANSGAGTYTVGHVPATVISSENNLNCAGWTLAVVYQNPNMFTSNLTLFVGCEAQGSSPALVSGFQAPSSGTITSRLFVSALEGDAQLTGDHFLVGATSSLSYPTNALSGTNNPVNNFFGSQMNTLLPLTTDVNSGKLVASGSSTLDTRGSFGTSNSDPSSGTNVSGARQGYDITSVDMGSTITNGQTQLYAQGTTNQDVYTVNALGIQIQVQAPLIQAVKQTDVSTVSMVGDTITYTITLTNIGETTASSLVFTDILPTGLTLVSNSFTVNGTPVSNPDLVNGVPLGDLAVNATTTVIFQAQVTQINPPSSYDNVSTIDYSYTPFGGSPIDLQSQTNTASVTSISADAPMANPDTGTAVANVPLNGSSVLTNDTGTGIFVSTYDHTTTQAGTVVMQSDGTYVYTPPSNFSGTDTFTYTISDPLMQTAMTTVTLTVLPQAQNDVGSVAADTPLNGSSVLTNDAGTGLTVTSYDMTSTSGGTIVMQPDGTYIYNPPNDFSGTDNFNYVATDSSGNPTTGTVTITVLPVAENDFGTTPANTVLNGSTVFTNDMGSGLMLIAYDHTSVQGGTVVMNMMDGTYVYTPPSNFSGLDTFTYTVQDQDGDMSVATVSITVLPVAVNDTGTTPANTPLNQMTSVLSNDAGTGLTVTAYDTASLQGGTIVMQTNGTYLYTPPFNYSGPDSFNYTATDSNSSTTSASVMLTVTPHATNDTAITNANTTLIGPSVLANDTGTTLTAIASTSPTTQGGLVSINTNGTYTYVPPTGFSGIDTFTYTAVDAFNDMTMGTVTITVLPVAVNDTGSTPENIPLNGTSVLSNDIGTGLSIASYDSTTTAGGTVVMNTTTGTYTYTPPTGFVGLDTFSYTIKDSSNNTATATVSITVGAVLPPVNFKGTISKCQLLNKTEYSLQAQWSASPSPDIVFYRIYHNGKVVAGVRPGEPFVFSATCLKSKAAAREYSITALNSGNAESPPAKIKIQ
ncbi:MAG: tandem-95 repeat protein [Verrucomicrobia bacterium]|nr:tandem-95 repeat protein [Verrucomicrobiota bacterium]